LYALAERWDLQVGSGGDAAQAARVGTVVMSTKCHISAREAVERIDPRLELWSLDLLGVGGAVAPESPRVGRTGEPDAIRTHRPLRVP